MRPELWPFRVHERLFSPKERGERPVLWEVIVDASVQNLEERTIFSFTLGALAVGVNDG